MKVETGTVTILRISEVPHLDPIRVTLDDIGPGQGRINIECYGKAWASYWGAMGKDSIAEFFVSCSNDYLIGNLSVGLDSSRPSGDALERDAKRVIRHRRKVYTYHINQTLMKHTNPPYQLRAPIHATNNSRPPQAAKKPNSSSSAAEHLRRLFRSIH